MNLKDIIAKLPEAERAEAEKAIQDAIVAANPVAGITSKEQAAEFISKNPFFKGALDSEISVKIAAHDDRFMADKLPKLLEAEVKKLTGPETDPIRIELNALKAEREAEKAELKREKLTAAALKIALAEGIPGEDVARFIADDEDKTAETVKAYASRLKAYRDAAVESALKERLGNNGQPKGGTSPTPTGLKEQYDAAMTAGNADLALAIQSRMQAATHSDRR